MKKAKIIFILSALTVLVSCSKDDEIVAEPNSVEINATGDQGDDVGTPNFNDNTFNNHSDHGDQGDDSGTPGD